MGCSSTKVGWTSPASTVASNISLSRCPGVSAARTLATSPGLAPRAASTSAARALAPSSSSSATKKSSPVSSSTRSRIEARRKGWARSMRSPWYVISAVPQHASAHWRTRASVSSSMSVKSAYAWYTSTDVNSGLCRVEMPSLRNTRPSSKTRSMPPTTMRFRCSSVAMRRLSRRSSALWCVTNGRASAPPASVCSTGVSTSRNPRRPSSLRREESILARATKVSLTPGVTIMST
mmetsp:Transcript_29697/g.82980  ORF Transcript_29697/g.82980 Transcript_29697/m.82980 type:complete len:235 (-) Transcript_29697:297-1001(-)